MIKRKYHELQMEKGLSMVNVLASEQLESYEIKKKQCMKHWLSHIYVYSNTSFSEKTYG